MRQHIVRLKECMAAVGRFINMPPIWRRQPVLHVIAPPAVNSEHATEGRDVAEQEVQALKTQALETQCRAVGNRPWPGWNMIELDGLEGDAHGAATFTLYARGRILEYSLF